jgi:hypothetical protein
VAENRALRELTGRTRTMDALILAPFALAAAWYLGEFTVRTRIIFTLMYAASFALLLLPQFYVFFVVQTLLAILFGLALFVSTERQTWW